MMPDGMPLIVTEIRLSAGTGSDFSAFGTGADGGLLSHLTAWPVDGALDLTAVVVGPASGGLDEHAASEIAAAMLAVAINARFAGFAFISGVLLVFPVPRACCIAVDTAS